MGNSVRVADESTDRDSGIGERAGKGTGRTTRRAVLGGAIGGLGAIVVQAIGRPLPVRATANAETLFNNENPADVLSARSTTNADTTSYPNSGKGIAVHGQSDLNDAVKGESFASDKSGVYGLGWNSGTGVNGAGRVGVFGLSSENGWFGVWGRHTGDSPGVNGDSSSGPGIHGNSTTGYGGYFEGGKAQLRLRPKSTAGRPASGSHAKGELYLDSKGALFVCVATGTPGTWRKVTTTAA